MSTSAPYGLATLSPAEMQALVDAPLADPSKIYLPRGKRKLMRGPKPIYENEFAPKLTGKEVKARKISVQSKKLGTLLNYYATTEVPFSRIAEHTKLDVETVQRLMQQRGRLV